METNPRGERRCAVGVGPNSEPIFEQFVRLAWAEANHASLTAQVTELIEQKQDMNERIKQHIKNELRQKNENVTLTAALDRCVEALDDLCATVREVREKNTPEFMKHLQRGELVARSALEQAKKARG